MLVKTAIEYIPRKIQGVNRLQLFQSDGLPDLTSKHGPFDLKFSEVSKVLKEKGVDPNEVVGLVLFGSMVKPRFENKRFLGLFNRRVIAKPRDYDLLVVLKGTADLRNRVVADYIEDVTVDNGYGKMTKYRVHHQHGLDIFILSESHLGQAFNDPEDSVAQHISEYGLVLAGQLQWRIGESCFASIEEKVWGENFDRLLWQRLKLDLRALRRIDEPEAAYDPM